MTPVHCRVKHDPERGTVGDCVRACIATVLDLDAEKVPHFYHDDCSGAIGDQRIREFLATLGYAPFFADYDGSLSLDDFFEMMQLYNNSMHYILYHLTDHGNHVVVCKGDRIVHNPAWFRSSIAGPVVSDDDRKVWKVLVIVKQ